MCASDRKDDYEDDYSVRRALARIEEDGFELCVQINIEVDVDRRVKLPAGNSRDCGHRREIVDGCMPSRAAAAPR